MLEKKEKVFTAETIEDQPLPDLGVSKNVGSSFFSTITKFFTGLFKFGEKGGLQIGEYIDGVQGKITMDINGLHAYDTSDKELVRVNTSGFHGYNTLANELIKIDSLGLHGYDTSAHELIKIDSSGFHGYNASGTKIIKISSSGSIEMYGANDSVLGFRNAEGGSIYGIIGYYSGTNSFYMQSSGAGRKIHILADGVNIQTYSGSNVTLLATGGKLKLYGDTDVDIQAQTSGGKCYLRGTDSGGANSGGIYFYNYDLADYVEKTAIVPTSQGYRSLYCTESPEVWFMDFCRGVKKRKWLKFWQTYWEVIPSKLFLETIESPIIMMPTLQKGLVQIWGKRKGFKDKRFEKKTKAEFDKNNEFWGQAHIKK